MKHEVDAAGIALKVGAATGLLASIAFSSLLVGMNRSTLEDEIDSARSSLIKVEQKNTIHLQKLPKKCAKLLLEIQASPANWEDVDSYVAGSGLCGPDSTAIVGQQKIYIQQKNQLQSDLENATHRLDPMNPNSSQGALAIGGVMLGMFTGLFTASEVYAKLRDRNIAIAEQAKKKSATPPPPPGTWRKV